MSPTPSPTSEADIVLALRAAGCVFAEDEAALLVAESTSASELEGRVERRIAGEPLEVILGWALFGGLRVAIGAGVFVPRRRTEFLVVEAVRSARAGAVAVDLCCGSGALGLAFHAVVPGARVSAADLDPAAVACARRNLHGIGNVYEGDLFDALPIALRGTVDVLMVNAPYVPSSEIGRMPPEARLYEPRLALDGGADGLDIHRRVAESAHEWLAPDGTLLIETSENQSETAIRLFERNRMSARAEYSEDYDATIVLGTRRD